MFGVFLFDPSELWFSPGLTRFFFFNMTTAVKTPAAFYSGLLNLSKLPLIGLTNNIVRCYVTAGSSCVAVLKHQHMLVV